MICESPTHAKVTEKSSPSAWSTTIMLAVVPDDRDWGPNVSSSFQNRSSISSSSTQQCSAHLRATNLPPCPSKTPNMVLFSLMWKQTAIRLPRASNSPDANYTPGQRRRSVLKKSSSFIEYISTPYEIPLADAKCSLLIESIEIRDPNQDLTSAS